MSIEAWLAGREGRAGLGARAERVVGVLVRSPQLASYSSAREVAERAGVNVSTVVRTAQQLGFEGWPDLRRELRHLYLESMTAGDPGLSPATDASARMLRQDAANLANLASDDNLQAIRDTAQAIRSARRTVVLSTGSGAGPASVLAYLGAIMGYNIHLALGPATTQSVHVARLREGDCLITVNVWRLSRALRGLTKAGHQRGATVCVFTDLHTSPLTEDADHIVITPIEAVHGGVSLTAMVAAVQAILAELTDADALRSSRQVEQLWEELNIMDDQA